MTFRRSSSIGSPLVSAIRKGAYRSSLEAWRRDLTPMETAFLSEVCPRALPEAMKAPWGFTATVTSLGFPATLDALIVRTIFLTSDGQRLSPALVEFSKLPVSRVLEWARLGQMTGVIERTTGQVGRVGVQLSVVSTLRAISQPDRMHRPEPLSAGYRANRSRERSEALAAMIRSGGRTPE